MKFAQKLRLIPEEKYQNLMKNVQSTQTNLDSEQGETHSKEHSEVNLQTGKGSNGSSSNKMSTETILGGLPKYIRRKGEELLRIITIHPSADIDWDQKGRIIYKGQLIPNTSITHLLRNTIAPLKGLTPIGASDFHEALVELNIPARFLSTVKPKGIERLPPPPGRRPVRRKLTASQKSKKSKKITWENIFK